MSTASPNTPTRRLPTQAVQSLPSILTRPVRAASFWTAVLLPLAYPALLYGGVRGDELLLLVAAIAAHAVALRAGRGYKAPE